jgi:hypothetical protein
MARTDSQLIYQDDGSKQVLSEAYGGVLENYSQGALSARVKNNQWSGDPQSGSVEFDRILNTAVEDYDADAADKHFEIEKVTVNIDTPKMIRERATQWDLDEYGIEGIIERKAEMYTNSMIVFADRQFFSTAENEGSEVTLTSETDRGKLDELIREITDAETDYADGVDESLVHVFLKSDIWDDLKADFDVLSNPAEGGVTLYDYNGVNVHRNFRQTEDAIIMVAGAGAMPIAPIGTAVDKIAGSVEYYIGLYFKYGLKMIMPELVKYASFSETDSA